MKEELSDLLFLVVAPELLQNIHCGCSQVQRIVSLRNIHALHMFVHGCGPGIYRRLLESYRFSP
jgi:hypothetical protein